MTKQEISKIVDEWFSDNFQNTTLAQNTEVYNALILAKQDLKDRLEKK